MTREEAVKEIKKAFEPAFANYIITALTEGATVSDIQHRWGRAYEAGVKDGLEQEPCEDAVSRAEVKKIAKEMYLEVSNMELDAKTISDCISCTSSKCREVLEKKLQALSPVTPQEPNTWSLDDAREDFMHDVYNELDFLPTNEEANRIIDIFDRVTSSIEQEPRKGHWIDIKNKNGTVIAVRCSKCGNSPKHAIKSDFCPNCGADMREV